MQLTEEEAIDLLWLPKTYASKPDGRGINVGKKMGKDFDPPIYATLLKDTEMHVWNNKHPVEENIAIHVSKAGTTVFVPMISRFGDVGVRDENLDKLQHGYYARVMPEELTDWRTTIEKGD